MVCCEDCYWKHEGKKNDCWYEHDKSDNCGDYEPLQSEEWEDQKINADT